MTAISDERLAEHLSAEGYHAFKSLNEAEVRSVVTELQSLRAQAGVRVKPWETRPQGEDALEPSEVDVHQGAWAIVVGSNGKPAGWIDTHALFAHQLYRDQALPLEASPAVTGIDALRAIANLPFNGNEAGHEEAYRAVEALFPTPPMIEASHTPVIHVLFETKAGPITGTQTAPIKRVDQEDDGSFTVVIDHWPESPAPIVELSQAAKDHMAEIDAAIHRGAEIGDMLVGAPVSEECATDGCSDPATVRFERGGVGSQYCRSCYLKVQALAAKGGQ